jgi:hypothetical protein
MQVTPNPIAHLAQALANADGHGRTGQQDVSWECHGMMSVLLPPRSVAKYPDREITVALKARR